MVAATCEELELWSSFKERGDASARNQLVVLYLELVRRTALASPRARACDSLEDAVAEAYVALVECVDRFRPEVGVSFWTWARGRIYGAVRDAARKARGTLYPRTDHPVYMVPVSCLAEEADSEAEIFGQAPQVEPEDQARVGKLLLGLPKVWRWVTHLWLFEELGHAEVAKRLGFSYTRSAQVWRAACRRLRELVLGGG